MANWERVFLALLLGTLGGLAMAAGIIHFGRLAGRAFG